MSNEDAQRCWLETLDAEMRRECSLQRASVEEIWAKPLEERVEQGHCLGPLRIVQVGAAHVTLNPSTNAAELAQCSLRDGDFVRLSDNSPKAPVGHYIFLGEDHDGIHLKKWKGGTPAAGPQDWTIDPDFFDLTDRFAEALDELGATSLGREQILPLLMGEQSGEVDGELFDKVRDELDEPTEPEAPTWHSSQRDAIACCIAAEDSFLVQGPPGTGKTRVLGEVARRLVDRGQRLLVTGPTHRAIHNALATVRDALPDSVRVAKIGPSPLGGVGVECHESYAESGLLDCADAHVVGATPHALWSGYTGLRGAMFDTVLLDESSQLTPLLAAMAMLRAEKWLFFGDDCQLPPVVLADTSTPPRLRSVFGVLKNRDIDCLLEETWRLNKPLAAWPSATFYGNRLVCRHNLRLQLAPASDHPALAPDPALTLLECRTTGDSVRSDEESQLAAGFVRDVVAGGVEPERIGVITPFRAQAARIRQLLAILPELPGLQRLVVTDTVERFQGQERDVIIVSLVSSAPLFIHRRADFLFQRERLNVALTRARLKTILLASTVLIESAGSLADAGHEGATCFSSLVRHIRSA